MSRLFDLTGQVALVTGGGHGLGREMAFALAEAGASVVIPDLIAPSAEDAATQIAAATGRETMALQLDVADPAAVERCFDVARDHFGRLDILINNAGIGVLSASEDATRADWQHTFDVNVAGLFQCCQCAGRMMLQQGRGKIVNIASIYGLVGTDQRLYVHDEPITHQSSAYNASKGAVISLTRSLAVEWAARGVHVNAIAPGMMDTGKVRGGLGTQTWVNLAARTPMRRIGTPADLRGPVLFLSSAASDFVTGHVLVVDGGWTAW